jgi:hypothetical protein
MHRLHLFERVYDNTGINGGYKTDALTLKGNPSATGSDFNKLYAILKRNDNDKKL